MLLIFAAVVVFVALAIPSRRIPGGANASALGWMSEQWLIEHRASHSP